MVDIMKYCILFCKIVDVTVDAEGNIYLIINKETKSNVSLEILNKFWKNKDVGIIIYELIRMRRDDSGKRISIFEQRDRETDKEEQATSTQSVEENSSNNTREIL
jgi:hypothetical protein